MSVVVLETFNPPTPNTFAFLRGEFIVFNYKYYEATHGGDETELQTKFRIHTRQSAVSFSRKALFVGLDYLQLTANEFAFNEVK